MRLLAWLLDSLIRCWKSLVRRTDAVEDYDEKISDLRRKHAIEVEDYKGQIEILNKQIELLALAHENHRSIIERDIALNNRDRAGASEARVK